MEVINVTKSNFEEVVLKSDKPVLVDFWADWCGPCQMMGPVVHEIAEERDDVKVCKVDVNVEMELAKQYRVLSIPAFFVFKDGKAVASAVGTQEKKDLIAMFE